MKFEYTFLSRKYTDSIYFIDKYGIIYRKYKNKSDESIDRTVWKHYADCDLQGYNLKKINKWEIYYG